MAVPKRKQSNSRTGQRRSHDHKKPRQLTICVRCNWVVPTHHICPKCGHYMGRNMVNMETTE